jgi:hypothetical protein
MNPSIERAITAIGEKCVAADPLPTGVPDPTPAS